MQRTHEDDLCGFLQDKQKKGEGEDWHTIIVPAITTDENGEETSYHPERYPLTALHKIRKNSPDDFSTQYQQEPVNKDSQEFHEEFFRYYEIDSLPKRIRIFTVCDPAFKTKEQNDETAIITGGFYKDKLYILEVTHGRMKADAVAAKMLYHAQKWKPEKIGIEGYNAQTVLAQWVKKTLIENHVTTPIEEIIQKGDKESKIRQLQAPIRNGNIIWRNDMFTLEEQLKKFPRGKHDDVIDAMQMLYSFHGMQPNTERVDNPFKIRYNHLGQPIFL
jgi:predicted phage terminase large subunit-like protein